MITTMLETNNVVAGVAVFAAGEPAAGAPAQH